MQSQADTLAPPALEPAQEGWFALLRGDVRCVLQRDPAARSLLEVWTIYPGVQAIALHRVAHALWRRGWRYLPRWGHAFVCAWPAAFVIVMLIGPTVQRLSLHFLRNHPGHPAHQSAKKPH